MKVLEVKNLIKSYIKPIKKNANEDFNVLKGICFSVDEGEFIGVMGKSGCGKTTLLKIVGMIDRQTDGEVFFGGVETTRISADELADIRRLQIGFIFQDFYLMESLTVEENIMMPMILGREKVEIMNERVMRLGKQFQIEKMLKKNPYELSGGEKQRVAICRALVNNPNLILADEPTGNLDSKSGKIVIEELQRINQEYGKTIVMVTHDPLMASKCSRVIFLKDGQVKDTVQKNDEETFYHEILMKMADL